MEHMNEGLHLETATNSIFSRAWREFSEREDAHNAASGARNPYGQWCGLFPCIFSCKC